MPAYKDSKKGTWIVSFYFRNWKGENEKKMKRGFSTKREALEWERTFLQQQTANLDMTFAAFVELYKKDMKERIREHTWQTKNNIIHTKILPYFQAKKMSGIKATDVIAWQNSMIAFKDDKGKSYAQTYLKSLHNQLSAIFNHAVRFYDLKSNPAAKAGYIGKKKPRKCCSGQRTNI